MPASHEQVAGAFNRGRFHVETYGCQMNVSDSEIVRSIMQSAGYRWTDTVEKADVVFANTCAIRDNAEQKVWRRLNQFKAINDKVPRNKRQTVGVLGCMAERLKTKLLETDQLVDIVVGPDAYRDLPRLLQVVRGDDEDSVGADVVAEGAEDESDPANEAQKEAAKELDMAERASVQLSIEVLSPPFPFSFCASLRVSLFSSFLPHFIHLHFPLFPSGNLRRHFTRTTRPRQYIGIHIHHAWLQQYVLFLRRTLH